MGKMGLINVGFLGFMFMSSLILCKAQVPSTSLEYNFVLEESYFQRHCTNKSMLTVNRSFPGPEIRVHKGDTVKVNVQNNGDYGVTIHWHGVKQPRNPWSDGPEAVTQCLIQSGSSFTQEIIFSDEEGTLWWHAHSDWTRATVHGAIAILPDDDTYPFSTQPDGEETLVLASWYDEDVMTVYDQAANYTEPDVSDAFTINGLIGNYTSSCSNDSTFTMTVDSGKTYLLRIVNAVLNEAMFFSIANHTLTVVGMDGAYVKPINATYIMISPGNTMDVLLTADQALSHYYMAATSFSNGGVFDNTTTTAILMYNGTYDPPSSPFFPNSTLPSYDDTDAATSFMDSIRNVTTGTVPNRTVQYNMTIAVYADQDAGTRFASISNISFILPSDNNILQAYASNTDGVYTTDFPLAPNGTLSNGTRVIMLNLGEVVEIVFQGTDDGAEDHPMHVHGHSFYLLGSGAGTDTTVYYNETTDSDSLNLADPPLLNTVSVPKYGWAVIRFVANNPGVWFIHCHLERHVTWGMATALIVGNGTTVETSMLASPKMPTC